MRLNVAVMKVIAGTVVSNLLNMEDIIHGN